MTEPTTAAGQYASDVVRLLARHVPNWDDTGELAVLEAVASQAANPCVTFEVIVDSPHSAYWRLRPSGKDERRVLLYNCNPAPRPRGYLDIEYTTNALLDALPIGSSGD